MGRPEKLATAGEHGRVVGAAVKGVQELRVAVVGAGIGGLAAAIDLARRGARVTLLERAPQVGGKLRLVRVADHGLDAGPTVLTLVEVFEELFASAGRRLTDALQLHRVERLARHWFADGATVDLYSDAERSAQAIAEFAGKREASGYRRFVRYAAAIYDAVREPFLRSQRPSATTLLRYGFGGLWRLRRIEPWRSLMAAVCDFFHDPRLRQLFGRYATYAGSSPYLAPATLNVIAHVERLGVYRVEGGMYELAKALERLARDLGVAVHCDAEVESILAPGRRVRALRWRGGELRADAVVVNADVGALAGGMLGDDVRIGMRPGARSLSALTWHVVGRCSSTSLIHHNVFFSADYAREFADLFGRAALPEDPTVYVCGADRGSDGVPPQGPERLLVLANAPAAPLSPDAVSLFGERVFARLRRAGLVVTEEQLGRTTPADFAHLFPGSSGALYGAAAHGWRSAFSRPGARTSVRGLYLAGGGAHPGAGVPLAALSGRLAAAALAEDYGGAAA